MTTAACWHLLGLLFNGMFIMLVVIREKKKCYDLAIYSLYTNFCIKWKFYVTFFPGLPDFFLPLLCLQTLHAHILVHTEAVS